MGKARDEYDEQSSWSRVKRRDWSGGLPELTVELIYERLPLVDRLSFKQVCKSWSVAAAEYDAVERKQQKFPHDRRGIPWLVMSGQHERRRRSFYSVLEKQQLREVELPEAEGHYFWGSFHDWLIAVKPPPLTLRSGIGGKKMGITLLNPFYGAHVRLPPASLVNHKLVISGSPLDPTSIYMLLGKDGVQDLDIALWINNNPTSGSWCECHLDYEEGYYNYDGPWACDALYIQGLDCFYFLGQDCNIRILDAQLARDAVHKYSRVTTLLRTRLVELQIIPDYPKARSMPQVPQSFLIARNLVLVEQESGGGIILLMVCRFFRRGSNGFPFRLEMCEVKVYRLDLPNKSWVLVHDLGNQVLFVGKNCSKSYPWRDIGGLPNSIYFSHEGMFGAGQPQFNEWEPRTYARQASQSGDWSIFVLGNGNDNDKFSYIKENRHPPIWLTAPLPGCSR